MITHGDDKKLHPYARRLGPFLPEHHLSEPERFRRWRRKAEEKEGSAANIVDDQR